MCAYSWWLVRLSGSCFIHAATLSFISHTAGSERSLQVFGVQIEFVCALRDWYRTYAPQFYEPMRDDIEKVRDLLAEDDHFAKLFAKEAPIP